MELVPLKEARRWKSTVFLHTCTEEKPCEHAARSKATASQDEGPHQEPDLLDPGIFSFQNYDKQIFCLSHSAYGILL